MSEGFRNPAARVAATDIYVFTYARSIGQGKRPSTLHADVNARRRRPAAAKRT